MFVFLEEEARRLANKLFPPLNCLSSRIASLFRDEIVRKDDHKFWHSFIHLTFKMYIELLEQVWVMSQGTAAVVK